jgi:osmoprotectant transport system permease protein
VSGWCWILAQSEEPLIRWDWVVDHLDEIGADAVQHVQLVVASVGLGFLIAFPLAVLAHRHRRTYAPITWATGILYTIPSLAAIAFLIPITGLSLTTVVVPLAGYNLLILIRNNVAGLDTVPDDVKEAAQGMGYRDRQSLWRIEVPLAFPVIVAGVRIATVSTIGLATIGGLIGRGGFGQLIFDGLETDFWTPLLLGSFLTVGFALLADLALLGLQRWATPWATASERRTVAT